MPSKFSGDSKNSPCVPLAVEMESRAVAYILLQTLDMSMCLVSRLRHELAW